MTERVPSMAFGSPPLPAPPSGDAPVSAPRPETPFIGAALTSKTTRRYPAVKRFFDMGFPMIPRPIKPIFIAASPSVDPPRGKGGSVDLDVQVLDDLGVIGGRLLDELGVLLAAHEHHGLAHVLHRLPEIGVLGDFFQSAFEVMDHILRRSGGRGHAPHRSPGRHGR